MSVCELGIPPVDGAQVDESAEKSKPSEIDTNASATDEVDNDEAIGKTVF